MVGQWRNSGRRSISSVAGARSWPAHHYRDFQVPVAQRVRRFREEVELIEALWTEDKVIYRGQNLPVENVKLATGPVLWMRIGHPAGYLASRRNRKRIQLSNQGEVLTSRSHPRLLLEVSETGQDGRIAQSNSGARF